MLKIAFN